MLKTRGSHVSMVISFVVFISFLVFLFAILQPSISISQERDAALSEAEYLLLDYLTSNLTIVTIVDDTESGGSCLQFVGFENANGVIESGNRLVVKNEDGNTRDYEWVGGDLMVKNDFTDKFYKIYQSDSIASEQSSLGICTSLSEGQYIIGLVRTERKMLEQGILEAINLYKTDYGQLKNAVGIENGEFGFNFIYSNGTVLTTGENIGISGVYTKESPLIYMDRDLNMHTGNFVIKIW